MRSLFGVAVLIVGGLNGVFAADEASKADRTEVAATAVPQRRLLPLPEEEDWSFLKDASKRTDVFDPVKYIPLDDKGTYLSVGGELRYFFEKYRNEAFGRFPGESGYLEQRYLLHGDLHLGENFRAFAEIQSEFIGDRPGGPRATADQNKLDLLEGFAEYRSSSIDADLKAPAFTVRAGRQQLEFGAGRLISSRERISGSGPNVLFGFDGVRAIAREGFWRLDAFAVKAVLPQDGIFDDKSGGTGRALWGAYLTNRGIPGAARPGFDAYYYTTTRDNAIFYKGRGDEVRHTTGARAFRQNTALDYDFEAFTQFGDIGQRSINAWAVSGDIGYTFKDLALQPRPGIRAGINSGGGNAREVRDAFVPFPRGIYFGQLAIGPENLAGIEPNISLKLTPTLTLSVGTYFFFRQSLNDGIYTLSGNPLSPPVGTKRYVGYEPEMLLSWQINDRLSLNAGYDSFQRADYLRSVSGTRDVNYFDVWTTFRF